MPWLLRLSLMLASAVAEVLGSYLFFLCVKKRAPPWLLALALASLALFAWLLTLQPGAASRTYAAYGGIYVAASVAWLRVVERQTIDGWDLAGAAVMLVGAALIALVPR